MEKQKAAIMCNNILAHLSSNIQSTRLDIDALARAIGITPGQARKCIKYMFSTRPEWFASVYFFLFRIKAVELNKKNINEIRYFISQQGFCELPLFLARV